MCHSYRVCTTTGIKGKMKPHFKPLIRVGDGLGVSPTAEGARLRCVFQRLEGEATREGLWLTSTVSNAVNDSIRGTVTGIPGKSGSEPGGQPHLRPNENCGDRLASGHSVGNRCAQRVTFCPGNPPVAPTGPDQSGYRRLAIGGAHIMRTACLKTRQLDNPTA